ncbi:MATE family efflux transporter [Marinibactrum halimedae]|uniref:MATE family efflux transporter n=1 Tax=Marinibactrum halimedae TaxID=1444977 RepID=A0AA37WL57_9GAMM|nr:MATE family efflux transporter [Marinibactrum halimedae]MCD9459589.1 MATE family efflux transporter [Marinibactrum halimedae]GLS25594.1 MATE family efflux transporter [Marinibactrum halimedae]
MTTTISAKLVEGSVSEQLRRMAIPMTWAILAMMSFSAVDTYFVAQLGETPLAAMSFTFPVVMVLTSVAIGLGAGASSVLARSIGSGDEATARRLATDAISLSCLISVAFAVLLYGFNDWIFLQLGAPKSLLTDIRAYMGPWLLGAPALVLVMVSMSALRAMGMTSTQSKIMIISGLVNVVLDPLLIFGLGPIPRMELAGAAWASFITRWITLFVALWLVGYRLHLLTSPFCSFRVLWQSWRSILHVGVPAMATNVIIPLSSGFVVALVAREGESAVAGLGVATRLEPIALVVFYALSSVVGPFFGQNQGAGRYDRLQEALRQLSWFCLGWGVGLAVLFWVLGGWLVGFFSDIPEVRSVALSYLMLVPISYGAYGIVMSVNAAFNGLAKPMPGVVISACRVLILYMPLAWLGLQLWGVNGVFIATAACNLLVGGIAFLWMRRTLNLPSVQ